MSLRMNGNISKEDVDQTMHSGGGKENLKYMMTKHFNNLLLDIISEGIKKKFEQYVTSIDAIVRMQCMMNMLTVITSCSATLIVSSRYVFRSSCTTITTHNADEKNHPICNRMATQC